VYIVLKCKFFHCVKYQIFKNTINFHDMKKLYFIIVFFGVGVLYTSISAQKSTKSSTSNFKPSWFIGANGGINWYLAEGNDIFDSRYNNSLGDKFGSQFNGVLGYNFSPVHALRGMVGYNQFKYNVQGETSEMNLKIPNAKLNLDYVLNVTNLAKGYDPSRVFTFSLFAGLGGAYIDRNVETSKFGGAIRGGLQGDFHLNPKLALNIILDGNLLTDNFNDQVDQIPFDANAGLSLGLTYRFQKNEAPKTIAPDLVEPVAPAPVVPVAPVEPEKPQVAVVEPVKEQPAPVVQTPATKEDVFFKFNSRVPEGATQDDNMKRLAEYLKNNPSAKVVVSGYADNSSGTEAINDNVSKQRAVNVAQKLVNDYGVDPDRLMVKWYGGKVQPYKETWQNRVVILETATDEQMKDFSSFKDGISTIVNDAATMVEINFAASKAGIVNDTQRNALSRIAKYLQENPSASVTVDGYASSTGSLEMNDEISKNRAIAVANMLIAEYGVKYNRIKVGWFGSRVQPYKVASMNQLVIVKAK